MKNKNSGENKTGKIDIKEIIVCTAALAIISGGVTAALAGTNAMTKSTIAEMNDKAETAARQQVMDADRFEKKTLTEDGKEVIYYSAYKDNNPVGYVFTTSTTGKSSGLIVMTGINSTGKITGVIVTDDNETAGYVDKVKNGGLMDRFIKKDASKELKLGSDIDGVSQATKTSKGVTAGVNLAIHYYSAYIKGAQ